MRDSCVAQTLVVGVTMQPKTSAVVYCTLSYTPPLAWVLFVFALSDRVPFEVMLLLAIGFLLTSVLALVGSSLALVLAYRDTPPSQRRSFAITTAVFFALPWATLLLLAFGA